MAIFTTNQFAVINYVIVPTGQTPPRPEDQRWFLIHSGVALFTFQGQSRDVWRRDSLRLEIDLSGPFVATGRSASPGRELKFEVEQTASFATMNSIFDRNEALDAGFAVDAFRPIFTTRDNFPQIFDSLEVDLAVRDTDAFIFRIGYHLTLVGRVVEVAILPVVVPNMIGRTRERAEMLLRSAGLLVGTVMVLPPPDNPRPGGPVVVESRPAAGTEVPRGTRVDLDLQRQEI